MLIRALKSSYRHEALDGARCVTVHCTVSSSGCVAGSERRVIFMIT
jgi:hypothetical protein